MYKFTKTYFHIILIISVWSDCIYNEKNATTICVNISDIKNITTNDACRELSIEDSYISELPNQTFNFPNLLKINVIHCRISKMQPGSFSNLVKLQHLNLAINEITQIPNDLVADLFLQSLNLTWNKLENPTLDTFYGLNKLLTLDVSHNRITYISLGIMDEMTKLKRFYLNNNALLEIPLGLFDQSVLIEYLDLSNNLLQGMELGVLDPLRKLRTLNLSNNNIKNISLGTFDTLVQLNELNLSGNNYDDVENGIFDQLTKMEKLNLSNNKLKTLIVGTFDRLVRLSVINLSYNKFETLPSNLFNKTKLTIIDLSYNKLTAIQAELLNLNTITEVYLNNNRLSILDTFGFTTLKHIDVRFNRLVYIEPDFFSRIINVKRFEIAGNPWHCPCLKVLINILAKRFIFYTKDEFFDGRKPSCIVSDVKMCDYKLINRTEYENALLEY